MKLPPKEYYSLSEVVKRWSSDIDSVIYYVENNLLKLSAKKVVLEYTSETAQAHIAFKNLHNDFEKNLTKYLSDAYERHLKLNDGNFLLDSPFRISHEIIFDLDEDDKLAAKLDNYAKCFIRSDEIERFEREHCLFASANNLPKINDNKTDQVLIIKDFINSIIDNFPKATSKDIISHCFECYQGNNRKLTSIKKIIAEMGIEHGGSGKRTVESITYMQNAPKYKPIL